MMAKGVSHFSQIGRLLLKRKVISPDQLVEIEKKQIITGESLICICGRDNLVEEEKIFDILKEELNIDRVFLPEMRIEDSLFNLIPEDVCRRSRVLPVKLNNRELTVAMADPTDFLAVDDLRFMTGYDIRPVAADERDLSDMMRKKLSVSGLPRYSKTQRGVSSSQHQYVEIIVDERDDTGFSDRGVPEEEPVAIRIVNLILYEAFKSSASDVHIEMREGYVVIRFRMDGMLRDWMYVPGYIHQSLVSRIKIMAELDIAERRRPQDGRVSIKISGRKVDVRISTLPAIRGEKVVLRLLDRKTEIKDVNQLGMPSEVIKVLQKVLHLPQGMILATGPTGSGKTTTLYSLVKMHIRPELNYVTIEDPVEYTLENTSQVLVKEKLGLRFAPVLRSVLRQDPDVIMVGEIRDYETAEVAVHAALTGHLVLSTLHTGSATATVVRLLDLGIQSYLITSAVSVIIAQRLVRKICPQCREISAPKESVVRQLGLYPEFSGEKVYSSRGCSRCSGLGYAGRTGIFEILPIEGDMKDIIRSRETSEHILRASARSRGMRTLLDDGVEKVRSGITSLEEIFRVLGPQRLG